MNNSQASSSVSPVDDGQQEGVRRIKVHKISRGIQGLGAKQQPKEVVQAMDRRIAEIIPGLADLSISGSTQAAAEETARELRVQKLSREQAHKAELEELQDIYNMGKRNPVDVATKDQAQSWKQQLRPKPRKIQLSSYQVEMINYQRMLMRNNVWYYRDRMSVPRGPCPVHTLKDAWVQGVVDENTLVWGQGLYDWLPMKNVKLLLPMIRTPEVRFGAWFKRTFSLKPALNRIRETRKEFRSADTLSQQVERMR